MTPDEIRKALLIIERRPKWQSPTKFYEYFRCVGIHMPPVDPSSRGGYGRSGGIVLSGLRKEGWIYIHKRPTLVRLTAKGRAKLQELSK